MDPGPNGIITANGKLFCFQKMMAEYILHGLINIICEVYTDDLLIYGLTEEEFLRHVDIIFKRSREYKYH